MICYAWKRKAATLFVEMRMINAVAMGSAGCITAALQTQAFIAVHVSQVGEVRYVQMKLPVKINVVAMENVAVMGNAHV